MTAFQGQLLENYRGGAQAPQVYDFDLNLTKQTATDGPVTNSLVATDTFFAFKNFMQSDVYIDRVAGTFTVTNYPDDPGQTNVFAGHCVPRTNAF